MMTQHRASPFLYLKARTLLRLDNRYRAFVKMYDSCQQSTKRHGNRLLTSERMCLQLLEGFAVPTLLDLPKGTLARHLGFEPASFVAQRFVIGKPLHKAGLTPSELLGAWMFLTEHLVAFRRHQILYTDLKPANVIARKTPLTITQIDFDRAIAATENGRYKASLFGYTSGYEAPEHGKRGWLRETAVVFQLGMLLAHSWMGLTNATLSVPGSGLAALRKKIARVGNPALAKLVADCLANNPEDRPSGYEAVLERIKKATEKCKTRKAVKVWKDLRHPYADRLAAFGLDS